jgi:hypothetical protein
MPEVSTSAMQIYLNRLSATIGVDEHLLLVLDWPVGMAPTI